MYKTELMVKSNKDLTWELLEDFIAMVPPYGEITVPAGFITDFASIPSLFHWFATPTKGKWRKASVIHDYLYFLKEGKRKKADDAFLYLMEQDGVPYFKRYAMYWAVRIGGPRWKK